VNDILRVILPAYLLAFFAIAFAWRSYLVWKRTGINPYVVGRSGRPIDFVENLYPFPAILLLATTLLYALVPSVYSLTAPITWLEGFAFRMAGLVLMAIGLVWTATAQMQMGPSWRIGIDLVNKTDLVEKGLFRKTRNPIFLGMRFALLGFFLALPNAFTLLSAVLLDVLMQVQVRLEEDFLRTVHADVYADYCSRVRRWI